MREMVLCIMILNTGNSVFPVSQHLRKWPPLIRSAHPQPRAGQSAASYAWGSARSLACISWPPWLAQWRGHLPALAGPQGLSTPTVYGAVKVTPLLPGPCLRPKEQIEVSRLFIQDYLGWQLERFSAQMKVRPWKSDLNTVSPTLSFAQCQGSCRD